MRNQRLCSSDDGIGEVHEDCNMERSADRGLPALPAFHLMRSGLKDANKRVEFVPAQEYGFLRDLDRSRSQ
jgi:hypothetical protein